MPFYRATCAPLSALKKESTSAAESSPLKSGKHESEASRRRALQTLLVGLAAVSARPALAAREGDAREGEIRHTEAEWRELLSEGQYAVLRTAATERPRTSPLYEVSEAILLLINLWI